MLNFFCMLRTNLGYNFINNHVGEIFEHELHIVGYWVKLGLRNVSKRGILQKSEREVLREKMFENKNIIFFLINYATH